MGTRNATVTDSSDISDGLDNTTAVGSPTLRNTLSNAINADLVTTAVVKKRNGTALINTWGTKTIRAGTEYVKLDGTKEILLYGYSSANSGFLSKLSNLAGSVKNSLHTAVKPILLQFNSQLFFFNQQDDFIYDGTTTHQIGIDAPVLGAPTLNVAAVGGSLNVSSSYIYAYTYYNSVTGAESTSSLYSNPIITGVADTKLTINIQIEASVANADKLRVYRSVGGGTFLQFEAEVALAPLLGTTYAYVSTIGDINLGDLLEPDNNRPPVAKYATQADNRIFLAGLVSNPNRIVYSKIGLAGPMPESFQALDFCDCDSGDGDTIVGLSEVNGMILVFKTKKVGVLIRIDAQVSGVELQGSTKYIWHPLSKTTTFLDNSCVVQLEGITVWLGHDDIYSTDGNGVSSAGQRIRNTIQTINIDNAWKYAAINKVDTKQFMFSVAVGTDTEPNFQIVGHYHTPGKLAYTFYSKGTNTTTHPGISAGSFIEVTATGNRRVYYAGTTDGTGGINQIDSGSSDLGLGIHFDVRTKWETGRSFAHRKKYHSCYVLVTGVINSPTLDLFLEVDGMGIVGSTTATITIGPIWDSVNWDSFNWSGTDQVSYNRVTFYPGIVGYIGRYGFSNTNIDEPVALQVIQTVYQNMEIN